MLARLERTLPRGDVWRYEPKLDGFRGLLWHAPSGSVHLLSRNLKDFSRAFPELVTAGRDLPLDTLIDGEIVIAEVDGRSNFGALQERLGKASRDAARQALQSPAVLLAFDLVRDAGADLAEQPLRDRRHRLEGLLGPGRAYLQLVAQTASVEEARDWLALVPGLEGVVAKRCDGRYLPGQREWVKGAPRQTSFIQEVQFLPRKGLARQRESSPALQEVTSATTRGQSDRQATTQVKRFSLVTIQSAEADRVFEREGNSRRGLWRLRRRLCRGQRAWHAGRWMDGGTGEAHGALTE